MSTTFNFNLQVIVGALLRKKEDVTYVKGFLEYHFELGVDYVYIYPNYDLKELSLDETYSSRVLISHMPNSSNSSNLPNPSSDSELDIVKHLSSVLSSDVTDKSKNQTWLICLDVKEFIVLQEDCEKIQILLSNQSSCIESPLSIPLSCSWAKSTSGSGLDENNECFHTKNITCIERPIILERDKLDLNTKKDTNEDIYQDTRQVHNQMIHSFHIDFKAVKTPLCEIGARYDTDKSSQRQRVSDIRHCHPYTILYHSFFKRHRQSPIRISEIGVLQGASLLMWHEYFENASIHGFDYDDTLLSTFQQTLQPLDGRVSVSKMNVKDASTIRNAFSSIGGIWDLILEDSTHEFDDQIRFVQESMSFLRPGGMLIIEDVFLHHSESLYWERLQPVLSEFQSAFFVRLDHARRCSTGWDNDKVLILIKKGAPSLFTPIVPRLQIITPSCRPENLLTIKSSIRFEYVKQWMIVYDGARVSDSPIQFPHHPKIQEFTYSGEGISGNPQRNFALQTLVNRKNEKDQGTYLYFLDDDNRIHPGLYDLLSLLDDGYLYTFNQLRDTNGSILKGNRLDPGHIDTAMALIASTHSNADIRWKPHEYGADGFYIQDCGTAMPNCHIWINNTLCTYNHILLRPTEIIHTGIEAEFDPSSYLMFNPVVASNSLYNTLEGARAHWILHGQFEKRAYFKKGSLHLDSLESKTMPILLSANAKDEKNLVEWVMYHLALGFTHILLFDDFSKIPIEHVLEKYVKTNQVTVVQWHTQKGPYIEAAVHFGNLHGFAYMIHLDLDEYLYIKPEFSSIQSLVKTYPVDVSAIYFHWMFFGSNQLEDNTKNTLIDVFTRSEDHLNPHIKTLVNPSLVSGCRDPHTYHFHSHVQVNRYNGKRERIRYDDAHSIQNQYDKNKDAPGAYIAHYCYQSWQEYLVRKIQRVRDDIPVFRDIMAKELFHALYNNKSNMDLVESWKQRITTE
ncbi:MAG: hypothetical protein Sylvanvirus6_35 [Sylvanvirus sp.]|uniref:Uncharacterized protein n=1 Tax=Sylvanvirus sp. TaxID=2487774 RepID=A0A3G5AJA9_9VIRU|nr:MAG: hypothetical protein Sylvanvirus6_35 [Sylvanvirus sp.]